MYRITIKDKFDSAHSLPNHEGKCKNLHGHTWDVEVVFRAEDKEIKTMGSEVGMIMDFAVLKRMVKSILPDHCFLNELLEHTTAESIAKHLFGEIVNLSPIKVECVRIWESSNCGVEYSGR